MSLCILLDFGAYLFTQLILIMLCSKPRSQTCQNFEFSCRVRILIVANFDYPIKTYCLPPINALPAFKPIK